MNIIYYISYLTCIIPLSPKSCAIYTQPQYFEVASLTLGKPIATGRPLNLVDLSRLSYTSLTLLVSFPSPSPRRRCSFIPFTLPTTTSSNALFCFRRLINLRLPFILRVFPASKFRNPFLRDPTIIWLFLGDGRWIIRPSLVLGDHCFMRQLKCRIQTRETSINQ